MIGHSLVIVDVYMYVFRIRLTHHPYTLQQRFKASFISVMTACRYTRPSQCHTIRLEAQAGSSENGQTSQDPKAMVIAASLKQTDKQGFSSTVDHNYAYALSISDKAS